jgi:hypothetical protein
LQLAGIQEFGYRGAQIEAGFDDSVRRKGNRSALNPDQLMKEDRTMEPILMQTDVLQDEIAEELLVHEWRTEQLLRLGLPRTLAETFADLVDWHALAALVECGCPPRLALEIVR